MSYHAGTIKFRSETGKLPVAVTEVLERYNASVQDEPKKVNEFYTFTVDLGKSSGLEAMEFMRECGRLKEVINVVVGSYKPSIIQRGINLLKK